MANIYQLKAQNGGVHALEVDVRKFLKRQSANLITRIESGNSFTELHETPGLGAYFYFQDNGGNLISVSQDGIFRDYCAAQLNLVGFNQTSSQFVRLRRNLLQTLSEYFIK